MNGATSERSSSPLPLANHTSSEGSSSTSRNTGGAGEGGGGQESSSSLIDLTQPRAPRIIHPRTLPSESIEIIDLSSDDDSDYGDNSNANTNSIDDGDDDEVEFVSETPGTARAWSSVASGSSRPSWRAPSSLPGSETLLHAYHLGRHPAYPRSQDTPGLNWNRTEEHLSYTAHANANGIGSSNIQTQPRISPPRFHPYAPQTNPLPGTARGPPPPPPGPLVDRVVTAAMRRPTDARPDRSPIPSLPPAPRPVPARVRTGTSVDELMEQHAGMYHHFQRIMDQVLNRRLQMVDDQQSLLNDMMAWEDYRSQLDHTLTRPMFEGDRPPPRHHLLHNHNHNPGGRDRSPSIFGDMLQRLDFFDGAPPAATEAEMERERNAIETKPVVTRPGFTKTIDPNTVIACPLCTKEFGHESDKMPKLWVIVGCGHVVCGPCAEEIFITRKAIKGSTTTRSGSNSGRRMSLSRKTKGKGKAKWSPGPADMDEDATARKETGGEDESLDGAISDGIAPSPTSPASTARTITTTMGPNVKVIKKVMGACPGCQRKIKRTSLQQLYL